MYLSALLIIVAMIGLNALFAAYEIALASISVSRLKGMADKQQRGARSALHMKENMEASLAVVQLGITLVGAIAAAVGGARAGESISPYLAQLMGVSHWLAELLALALVVVPLSAVTIIVGELIPKVFALKNKELVCLRLSPMMHGLSLVLYPAVWLFETAVTRLIAWTERNWKAGNEQHLPEVFEMQELRAVVALARTSRLIGGQEERIILGAARLSGRPIAEIMIPASEMITLDLQHTMSECLVIAHGDMHTRFPVCAAPGNPQSIVGYVNFKDLVSELRLSPDQPSIRGIVRSMPDLPVALSIANSLERLIRGHFHIALVRDLEGQVVGMVTLEDILEELVGDILDEYDRAPTQVSQAGAGWVMGGGVPIARLEEITGVQLDRALLGETVHTLHDVVQATLQRPVRGGDVAHPAGLRIVVRKVRRQQVMEAQVSLDANRAHRAPIDDPTHRLDDARR